MEMYVRKNPDRPRYELVEFDDVVGVADYREDGDRLIVHHTEIARAAARNRQGRSARARDARCSARRGQDRRAAVLVRRRVLRAQPRVPRPRRAVAAPAAQATTLTGATVTSAKISNPSATGCRPSGINVVGPTSTHFAYHSRDRGARARAHRVAQRRVEHLGCGNAQRRVRVDPHERGRRGDPLQHEVDELGVPRRLVAAEIVRAELRRSTGPGRLRLPSGRRRRSAPSPRPPTIRRPGTASNSIAPKPCSDSFDFNGACDRNEMLSPTKRCGRQQRSERACGGRRLVVGREAGALACSRNRLSRRSPAHRRRAGSRWRRVRIGAGGGRHGRWWFPGGRSWVSPSA